MNKMDSFVWDLSYLINAIFHKWYIALLLGDITTDDITSVWEPTYTISVTFCFPLQASGPDSVYTKPWQSQKVVNITCPVDHSFLNFLYTSSFFLNHAHWYSFWLVNMDPTFIARNYSLEEVIPILLVLGKEVDSYSHVIFSIICELLRNPACTNFLHLELL